jgi:hypothetical protein
VSTKETESVAKKYKTYSKLKARASEVTSGITDVAYGSDEDLPKKLQVTISRTRNDDAEPMSFHDKDRKRLYSSQNNIVEAVKGTSRVRLIHL